LYLRNAIHWVYGKISGAYILWTEKNKIYEPNPEGGASIGAREIPETLDNNPPVRNIIHGGTPQILTPHLIIKPRAGGTHPPILG